jgi:hypothetical protein
MRLVWITILALICGGALIATKASTGKSASVSDAPVDAPKMAALQTIDTLTKTDKLSVAYVQDAIVEQDAPFEATPVIDPSPAEVSSPPTNTTELSKQAASLYPKQKKPSSAAKLKNAVKSKKLEFARDLAIPKQRVCAHTNYGLEGLLVALKMKINCAT